MNEVRIDTLGDQALLIRLGDSIDLDTNRRVHELAARVRERRAAWLIDCVPAYASLAIFIDTAQFSDRQDPLHEARVWLQTLLATGWSGPSAQATRLLEVPVCYGGESGPDLDDVALATGLKSEEVIARHCAPVYTVAMLGFAPGFPFLIGLDPALAVPRLSSPRTHVPGGSVAIGGRQTGVYPRPSPGGWRIVGRTPLTLFDPARDPPALLAPGDRVRFVPVDARALGQERPST